MTMYSMTAGLWALTLAFTQSTVAMAAEEIPTSITEIGGSSEYPDPICTTCKVKTVRSSRSEATHAFIELDYTESSSFSGELEVTVWLADGDFDTLIVPDVALAYGSTGWFEIGRGDTWAWDEVEAVELELVSQL
ncbi:hypothetical protein OEB96_44660 [Paraliomyxa miuraensis]|nr:hypothetical protein [Paraliomyxa miuraensis]